MRRLGLSNHRLGCHSISDPVCNGAVISLVFQGKNGKSKKIQLNSKKFEISLISLKIMKFSEILKFSKKYMKVSKILKFSEKMYLKISKILKFSIQTQMILTKKFKFRKKVLEFPKENLKFLVSSANV